MSDHEVMHMIRVIDLGEYCEGYGELWGMTTTPI